MDLSAVHVGVHRMRLKKRVGRGIGSGHGKTSSRGHKGQGSRAGAKKPHPLAEGGQMPLIRRIPKRGFSHNTWRKKYAEVNVGDLDKIFQDGDNIDHAALRKAGVAKGPVDGVRILGTGEVTKRLFITADHFSKSAKEKIEAKNGKATLVAGPKPPVRNKMRPRPSKQPS
jgi:large subunit ribosomal protein L15